MGRAVSAGNVALPFNNAVYIDRGLIDGDCGLDINYPCPKYQSSSSRRPNFSRSSFSIRSVFSSSSSTSHFALKRRPFAHILFSWLSHTQNAPHKPASSVRSERVSMYTVYNRSRTYKGESSQVWSYPPFPC
jgi:hypothetical protein